MRSFFFFLNNIVKKNTFKTETHSNGIEMEITRDNSEYYNIKHSSARVQNGFYFPNAGTV